MRMDCTTMAMLADRQFTIHREMEKVPNQARIGWVPGRCAGILPAGVAIPKKKHAKHSTLQAAG